MKGTFPVDIIGMIGSTGWMKWKGILYLYNTLILHRVVERIIIKHGLCKCIDNRAVALPSSRKTTPFDNENYQNFKLKKKNWLFVKCSSNLGAVCKNLSDFSYLQSYFRFSGMKPTVILEESQ